MSSTYFQGVAISLDLEATAPAAWINKMLGAVWVENATAEKSMELTFLITTLRCRVI